MHTFIIALALSLLAAAFVLVVVAYPHRGRRAPGPAPVSSALDKVGGKVSAILEDVSSSR